MQLFVIGHSVELYLKSCYTKLTGNAQKAVRFGHDIAGLWSACKQADHAFMPHYELLSRVLAANVTNFGSVDSLTKDEQLHFLHHQSFYLVAKHLPDLKYLGAPLKTIKGEYAIGAIYPDDYWVSFIRELRRFLGHPTLGHVDAVRDQLESGNLHHRAILYLSRLYRPPAATA